LSATALFEGMRAGAGTFRVIIDLPARARVGSIAFAEFSRATDLSTRGIVFYALYGFGGLGFTATTWWMASRAHAPASIRRLCAVAALSSFAVLLLTTQAAPLMWSVGVPSADAARVGELLDRFTFWTLLRVLCVDVSFLSVVAALTILALRGTVATSVARSDG
jgi:hypothetical protein